MFLCCHTIPQLASRFILRDAEKKKKIRPDAYQLMQKTRIYWKEFDTTITDEKQNFKGTKATSIESLRWKKTYVVFRDEWETARFEIESLLYADTITIKSNESLHKSYKLFERLSSFIRYKLLRQQKLQFKEQFFFSARLPIRNYSLKSNFCHNVNDCFNSFYSR